MSSNEADKRVTASENEKEVKVERVNVIPLYRKQHRAMPQYTTPVFTQLPKVTAPYQDKRFVMTEGGGFQGSFVSRSSIGVTFSTAKDDRRTCTSSSSVPLLPTPTLKKSGYGVGGAWKTYAQARTTEERSATSIPYQRHRSGKDIRINNYANPFNFDVRDESQRCAPGLIGESWHIPGKNSTVAESAASKSYENMLTSYHEFDRLCKVTATEGATFATERSPASFIATDSKWGNGLMPVMPRILPP
ncbi:SOSS complex subunit C [Orchesella cincta]|uniref:SOSS complex subunit C n=1 Tax=Orchesella cincta TaxID=48709 RepID=A0A1D2MMW5_ORCCI|nr:SOSS complex subunit C [Orchesella cincta]